MPNICQVCDGPIEADGFRSPTWCRTCLHLALERVVWIDDINEELTRIYTHSRCSTQELKVLLELHATIVPEMAVSLWDWNRENIGPFAFQFLHSLNLPSVQDALSYIQENSQARSLVKLLDSGASEKDIGVFLDENQRVLRYATGYCHEGDAGFCLREFRFGADYVADFVVINPRRSIPPLVQLVELEPVSDMVFTKRGHPSQRLVTAFNQIKQWKAWIIDAPDLFQMEINKRLKRALDPSFLEHSIRRHKIELEGFVFIGRRTTIRHNDHRDLWASTEERLRIHTYDTIADIAINEDLDRFHYIADLQTQRLIQRQRNAGHLPRKSLEELLPKISPSSSPRKAG